MSAVDEEFEHELGSAIRSHVPIGAQTVIAAWPNPREQAVPRLASIVGALERHGIPRGRQLMITADLPWPFGARILLGGTAPSYEGFGKHGWSGKNEEDLARSRAESLREALGITVIPHRAADSPCFFVDGDRMIAFNDEFREAEAVVLAGPWRFGGTLGTLGEIALGLCSEASREAARGQFLKAANLACHLDARVLVFWMANGAMAFPWEASSGSTP